jgi:hypothetical protein
MEYATPTQLSWAKWMLRLGLAFVYGYVAVEIYLVPANFIKYIPPQVLTYLPHDQFLMIFGIFEILLTLWFISGWHTEYPALISFFAMAGIIAPNLDYFSILFRNVAIATASLSLSILDWKHHTIAKYPIGHGLPPHIPRPNNIVQI